MDKTTTDIPETPRVLDLEKRRELGAYAPLAQIEGYWNALRGTRMMPLRSEIHPTGLKGALENCFVLERIAPGLARMRVAGSHLGDLMGMEVRGMPISAFLTPGSRDTFGAALEEVFQSPARATIQLSAETSLGRPPLPARIILLPVKSDLGDVSRILGGLATCGDIGRVPRRFNVDHVFIKSIDGVETPAPSTVDKLAEDAFRAPSATEARGVTRLPEFPGAKEREFVGNLDKYRQPRADVPYLRVVD